MRDKAIERLIGKEEQRQKRVINLIASENFVSPDVLRTLGSVFTNKYAEGYSHLRYYGGNEVVDELEDLVKERALKLFKLSPKAWSVNVQPYSGSPANLAVYHALVPVGGKIMGMALDMGGHLTHGHRVSVTGKLWKQIPYGVDRKTERLDYGALLKLAKKEKPALIVAGYTAYSRIIDFKKFRKIADAVVYPESNRRGAILMVDMSHFAGLVAGGAYPSPFPYVDVVTTTTHKTLRGPRAALIFARKSEIRNQKSETNSKFEIRNSKLSIAEAIDKAVFPGLQGGPHMNAIAAVGVALHEASQPAFKKYAKQVVRNAKALAEGLKKLGWRIVSGGTDTHLFLVDTFARGVSGKVASEKLERKDIIVNKNMIPYDTRKPTDPSGIRLGTPAVTTRGMKEKDMARLARRIDQALKSA
ncbi:MAG: serine hydroxymethyltransferase [Candidatus Jorgensenbacteria bacterium]